MKISFIKAKHFWEAGETATWVSAGDFDREVLNILKSKYNRFFAEKQKYVELNKKQIFLFYIKKKDVFGRPIVEMAALYSKHKFKDNDKVYKILKNQIENIFDENTRYEIEIDKELIQYNRIWIIYILLFVLAALLLYIFRPHNGQLQKPNTEKIGVIKSAHVPKEKPMSSVDTTTIASIKVKPKTTTWKWKSFCENNKITQSAEKCYQLYIQKKCELENSFNYSYAGFVQNKKMTKASCVIVRTLKNIFEDDKDIPNRIKKYRDFFTEGR